MSDCEHDKVVCPKHHGSFDCNSFCDICEGECEYCPICDSYAEIQADVYRSILIAEDKKDK